MSNDGGPAQQRIEKAVYDEGEYKIYSEGGTYVIDEYAKAALQGHASRGDVDADIAARYIFDVAEAMMRERERRGIQ